MRTSCLKSRRPNIFYPLSYRRERKIIPRFYKILLSKKQMNGDPISYFMEVLSNFLKSFRSMSKWTNQL